MSIGGCWLSPAVIPSILWVSGMEKHSSPWACTETLHITYFERFAHECNCNQRINRNSTPAGNRYQHRHASRSADRADCRWRGRTQVAFECGSMGDLSSGWTGRDFAANYTSTSSNRNSSCMLRGDGTTSRSDAQRRARRSAPRYTGAFAACQSTLASRIATHCSEYPGSRVTRRHISRIRGTWSLAQPVQSGMVMGDTFKQKGVEMMSIPNMPQTNNGHASSTTEATALNPVLRQHAEQQYAEELAELLKEDTRQRPPNWTLSPWAVRTYVMGGKLANGFVITPKYIGNARLIEIAVATLATDRALLLYGVPGTAKSWVSEQLAAAITGNSTLLIQGTAGTDEKAIRYGGNYARLLVEGPAENALVVSPMMMAMQMGKLARIEELTRIPSEVQDTLITILSEKTLPIPELNTEVQAHKGFNIIATANNRDKGVNELSNALMRRFNTVVLPLPATMDEEVEIVDRRVESLGRALELPAEKPALADIRRVIAIFRELRAGMTADGKTKIKSPSGTLSTAEAISVINSGLAMAAYYGDGQLHATDIAAGLTGAIVKDPVQDRVVWLEYLQTVVKERDGWKDLYRACNEVL